MDDWNKSRQAFSGRLRNSAQKQSKYEMWGKNSVYMTTGEKEECASDKMIVQDIEDSSKDKEKEKIAQNKVENGRNATDFQKDEKIYVNMNQMDMEQSDSTQRDVTVQNMSSSMCMPNRNHSMTHPQCMGNMRSCNQGGCVYGNDNMIETHMENCMRMGNMSGAYMEMDAMKEPHMGNCSGNCMGNEPFRPLEQSGNFTVGMGYIPMQRWEQTYDMESAIKRGTIFPSLDLPFMMGRCR